MQVFYYLTKELYFIFLGVFMSGFDYVERNYTELVREVGEISRAVGVTCPKIVAVTKSGSDAELIALVRAGADAIGENRPSELSRRGELLAGNSLFPELHQIGTLQSNKAKLVASSAALIHSLASYSLAKELSRRGGMLGRDIPVLIEINSAKEEQKDGVMPEDAERFMESIAELPGIRTVGLMTMGPVVDDPEDIRKYYRLTKELFDRFVDSGCFGASPILSMGMSDSYRVAIEEGSTLIRVGRRLFRK